MATDHDANALTETDHDGDALVEIQNVSKLFGLSQGVIDQLLGREAQPVRAVQNVDLNINKGDIMGIAGESGCGKTTLGKLLVKLYDPTEGRIMFDGRDMGELAREDQKVFRQRVQMIFQDPFESLNPRMTVFQSVVEPLKINDIGDGYQDRRERVVQVLNDVGLSPAEAYLNEFPKELSGGERQRVAIARALVVNPDFIVCDEPVSMLDVSIRAGVLNLMKELQEEYGLTYVFISHDLSLIRYMCDRTAIMYLGGIVEQGPTDEVVNDPKHPYTEALFDAVPEIEPETQRRRANVTGEVPNPRNPPTGCRFHPRCSKIIPSEDWTGSQEAFRRGFSFKHRVQTGDISVEDIAERHAEQRDAVDRILEVGLALELPEEHQLPGEEAGAVTLSALDMPRQAENALRSATRDLLDGNEEDAMEQLDRQFNTICEREVPQLHESGDQVSACHLYDPSTPNTEPIAPDASD
ncbi:MULTISPECIES: ABC transporter ATP-binding protein [unclassified Haladaptatus]|uniref:ABC transporter ATP-binding protein n=1 Tax=unclassified Haladaptatus TaxID=2622732 RepID=UPI00209C38DE|nr:MULTISPECIES: ABC transporter ATP-binding protein [unclassified Haladaptatus]MCO8246996.1 ABC transporter ATP-binding protein [Haladaptatus sp. AB643]MCO8254621.1 ABC transporter ATP-binding protein [Haladaptatus sp. AB618]